MAVAFSGGGDSLALLLIALAWAEDAGRRLLVLSVDHGVQPQSAAWTQACAAAAARLDLAFQALAWTGAKPATGLSSAARAARHGLLADAAREAGAHVILMGHTADDILEAQLMRARGSTTPAAREWGPSPAWPQGRGVFLLRPLLGVRRAEIRAWLTARGETWIDDPANESPTSARAQARREIGGGPCVAPHVEPASVKALARACEADGAGGLRIARGDLQAASLDAAARFAAIASLCAAGTTRPPARAAALRLAERLSGPNPLTASLAGARVEADGVGVRFLREAGEAARGGLQPLQLAAGQTGVWDGRFEIVADRAGEIRAAAGHRSRLIARDQALLAGLPAGERDTTPLCVSGDTIALAPARALALERLQAACGLVDREPA